MNKKMEILAPAGSMESLVAALRSGANAVYIGGKSFSARSSASNFENEEIAEAAKLCHLYGAKLYLAVNTVITDNEAASFCKFIADTAKIGIDAYIVQDTGCALLIKKIVPDAALHASTQMTVHTLNGAEFLKRLGFTRVVPARELSMAELSKIAESGLEIEAFVHGALCMSVSGQCYMSALIGSRSANRGGCAQACRLPFSACGNKDYCALSLKDLSLLSHTDELEKAGVCSLKIEGRMKRPEYVASAVQAVNDALNGKTPDMNMLRSIFSRDGFTDGYFTAKMQNMFGTRQKSDITSGKDILPVIRQTYNKELQKR
jgi:putative protease